jgi:hypothetical protein
MLDLLHAVSNTLQKREDRHLICGHINNSTLDKGNPAALGQISHFPTSQPVIQLLNDVIPDMLSLVGGPQL